MTFKNRVIAIDWQKWGRNAAIFFAPALLLALVAFQDGATVEEAVWLIRLWILNTAIDLLRKFIATNN